MNRVHICRCVLYMILAWLSADDGQWFLNWLFVWIGLTEFAGWTKDYILLLSIERTLTLFDLNIYKLPGSIVYHSYWGVTTWVA